MQFTVLCFEQQSTALRSEVKAGQPRLHPNAQHRVQHPGGERNNDPTRSLHLYEPATRSLLHAANADLSAKQRMPSVADFQILPGMGRMNA